MSAQIIKLDLLGDTKICTICGIVKSLDKFGSNFEKRSGKTYPRSSCLPCARKRKQEITLARKYENFEKLPSDAKRCNKCGEMKHISAFYTNTRKDGTPCLYSRCRPCAISDKKGAYERLKDKIKVVQKRARERYRDAGPHTEQYITRKLAHLKQKCKKDGIPFNLDRYDLVVPEYCPVLGMKLKCNARARGDDSASVDRINPRGGYVKGNIVVVSCLANFIKYTATWEQIRAVANFYERLEENNGGLK